MNEKQLEQLEQLECLTLDLYFGLNLLDNALKNQDDGLDTYAVAYLVEILYGVSCKARALF